MAAQRIGLAFRTATTPNVHPAHSPLLPRRCDGPPGRSCAAPSRERRPGGIPSSTANAANAVPVRPRPQATSTTCPAEDLTEPVQPIRTVNQNPEIRPGNPPIRPHPARAGVGGDRQWGGQSAERVLTATSSRSAASRMPMVEPSPCSGRRRRSSTTLT